MKIPQYSPSMSWKQILKVLRLIFAQNSGKASSFEEAFASFIGVKCAISVPSARAGLYFILKRLCLKEGDEVIVPAFTFKAVPDVIERCNLRPVYVDIDPITCTIDAHLIEEKISRHTRAIIPTHLFGMPCDMLSINRIARDRNLYVIEDCVQACGGMYENRRLGAHSNAGYFSFGITKNISMMGGGMITTDDESLAGRIRADILSLKERNTMHTVKSFVESTAIKLATEPAVYKLMTYPIMRLCSFFGFDIVQSSFTETDRGGRNRNSFFTMMPARVQNYIGVDQLSMLDDDIRKRKEIGSYYINRFRNIKRLQCPEHSPENIFTNFPLRLDSPDALAALLLREGIGTSRGFMRTFSGDCPTAQKLVSSILHIPVYPSLRPRQLIYIGDRVSAAMQSM
jgi:dTDP-4-amino-4,6-dideoxygalactose transaminase